MTCHGLGDGQCTETDRWHQGYMSTWRQAAQRNTGGKSNIVKTTAPVRLLCVVSATKPFGWGFPNDTVNDEAKDALKKLTCDTDNFTWMLKWWKVRLTLPRRTVHATLDSPL